MYVCDCSFVLHLTLFSPKRPKLENMTIPLSIRTVNKPPTQTDRKTETNTNTWMYTHFFSILLSEPVCNINYVGVAWYISNNSLPFYCLLCTIQTHTAGLSTMQVMFPFSLIQVGLISLCVYDCVCVFVCPSWALQILKYGSPRYAVSFDNPLFRLCKVTPVFCVEHTSTSPQDPLNLWKIHESKCGPDQEARSWSIFG